MIGKNVGRGKVRWKKYRVLTHARAYIYILYTRIVYDTRISGSRVALTAAAHRRCTLKQGMLCYKWCALAELASFIYITRRARTQRLRVHVYTVYPRPACEGSVYVCVCVCVR